MNHASMQMIDTITISMNPLETVTDTMVTRTMISVLVLLVHITTIITEITIITVPHHITISDPVILVHWKSIA